MKWENEKGEIFNTSFSSKQSKIGIRAFEVHTSVLVPLGILPVLPFWPTVKVCSLIILILVLLERRGWTVPYTYKRFRRWLAGPHRSRHTRRKLRRMAKY
jgi:hypothetical protein